MRPQLRRVAALVLVAVALAAGACGEDDTSAGGPTVVDTPVASTPAQADLIVKTPDADGDVTLVAHNLAFDADEVRAPAGALTLTIDNRDGGTPHNLHVFAGSDNTGNSIGDTAIENGPARASLHVQLDAGAYFFQCDVHPSMHGAVIAE
ncbi:MAG TPA: plastocyanin/azurin family copper-binding protein [Dehalococcoidia bacterium]|nr:plastocyanin/azurin family copper-binding protein [Dehalococcoidia bacterium]